MGALIWVPISAAYLFIVILSVVCKWVLLGRVEAGSWPLYGSFHMRKWFVDGLAHDRLLFVKHFAVLSGSPLANSTFVSRVILGCFGVRLGTVIDVHPWMLLSYDLLSVGDGAFFGNEHAGSTFRTEGDCLVGRPVGIGREVTLGARSVVTPGADMADYSAAAAYTVVVGAVESNEIVVGTEKFNRKQAPSMGDDGIAKRAQKQETVDLCMSLILWVGAMIITLEIRFVDEHVMHLSSNRPWDPLYVSAIIGVSVRLGSPVYTMILAVLSKIILVGRFSPDILKQGVDESLRSIMVKSLTRLMDFSCFVFISEAFAGTSIEVSLQRALGATIGKNVYLDGVWAFESDLLTIGDNVTINKGCRLIPHEYLLSRIEFGRVIIGSGCTVGTMSMLYGRVMVDEETEVGSMTMPLIGTHVIGRQMDGLSRSQKDETRTILATTTTSSGMVCVAASPVFDGFGCILDDLLVCGQTCEH